MGPECSHRCSHNREGGLTQKRRGHVNTEADTGGDVATAREAAVSRSWRPREQTLPRALGGALPPMTWPCPGLQPSLLNSRRLINSAVLIQQLFDNVLQQP